MDAPLPILSEHDLELLSAYLDGELTDREKEALQQRLAHEHLLRAALDELRETVTLVGDLPVQKAPRDFTLDPAIYGRQTPWWQRLFTIQNTLRLSGVVGAAASITLIVLAVLLSQESSDRDSMAGEVAFEAAPGGIDAAEPATLADETSIAYAGEGLLQSTIAMQSTFYAGTPAPQAQKDTPPPDKTRTRAAPSPVLDSEDEILSDTGDISAAAPATGGEFAASEAEEGSAPSPIPEPAANAVEADAAPIVAAAPPPSVGSAPSPTGEAALGAADSVYATTAETAPDSGAQEEEAPAQPENAHRDFDDDGEAGGNGADAEAYAEQPAPPSEPLDSEPGSSPEWETAATDTLSPLASPIPEVIAQGIAEEDITQAGLTDSAGQPAAHKTDEQPEEESNIGWLAGLGLVILVVSLILLAVGQRKARRA